MGRIIGLTGGIGSGKSTVAALLADRGVEVIDADRIAHEIYAPGTEGHRQVVERFGAGVVDDEGRVDRQTLGRLVFNDSKRLAELNAIVHPLVRKEVVARVSRVFEDRPDAVVAVEAALMTETGWTGGAGELWVVITDPEIAIRRLVECRKMARAEVELRVAVQADNEERRRHARRVIENNGTLEELAQNVDRVWREFESD